MWVILFETLYENFLMKIAVQQIFYALDGESIGLLNG